MYETENNGAVFNGKTTDEKAVNGATSNGETMNRKAFDGEAINGEASDEETANRENADAAVVYFTSDISLEGW